MVRNQEEIQRLPVVHADPVDSEITFRGRQILLVGATDRDILHFQQWILSRDSLTRIQDNRSRTPTQQMGFATPFSIYDQ